jgi:hypothetical protein
LLPGCARFGGRAQGAGDYTLTDRAGDKIMNDTQEMQFGSKVRHLLNQGTHLKPAVERRLAEAREAALSRQRPEPALAWADNVTGSVGWSGLALRILLPLALLVASGAALYTWQQNQRAAELEEIDSMLLGDDLPIDAYLDRGFQNWLKKRVAEE